jgi:aromatic-L-amino-acid decarboxylase
MADGTLADARAGKNGRHALVGLSHDPGSTMTESDLPRDQSLDPTDWPSFRAQGHRMLDDILDYIQDIEKRPVWQPIPEEARARFREPLPRGPSSLTEAHGRFMQDVLPFSTGNAHPGFMGWVNGGGTPVGMLAAGLNANLGGRDHMPIEVERQILIWMRELFGFPETASGLLSPAPPWPISWRS